MDQLRVLERAYRLEHRHRDGGWGVMEEQPQHHGAAEHDPERSWAIRRIFRCTSCDESVTIVENGEDMPARR